MCFYIHPEHPEMKTAKRDIVCYKNGYRTPSGVFRPLYRCFYRYVLGELNKIEDWYVQVEAGACVFGRILQGFHSYSNKKQLSRRYAQVKCIIPKGAHYFYNPSDQEYVSDQIIVQEFI